jgi:hypothetical protein
MHSLPASPERVTTRPSQNGYRHRTGSDSSGRRPCGRRRSGSIGYPRGGPRVEVPSPKPPVPHFSEAPASRAECHEPVSQEHRPPLDDPRGSVTLHVRGARPVCGRALEASLARGLSENRDRSEKVGKRGKTCVSTRRIARYLTKTYASLARFYRFCSRFAILGQPPSTTTRLRQTTSQGRAARPSCRGDAGRFYVHQPKYTEPP